MSARNRVVGMGLLALGFAASGSLACAPRAESTIADASHTQDVLLECTAADIRHLFRIRADARAVDDESFSPAKSGIADVSSSEYLLRFPEPRDHYELIVQIDKVSGTGMRRLFDDEQQAIKGHGGTDPVTCTQRATQ